MPRKYVSGVCLLCTVPGLLPLGGAHMTGFALSHILLRAVALIFAVWTTLALQNPCLEVPEDLLASGGDPPAL